MKTQSKELDLLIDKLIVAIKTYEKAAETVHNEPMKNQFHVLAERKKNFLRSLSKLLDVSIDEKELSLQEKLKLEFDKAWIELDDLILLRNEKEILSFIIKREDELISIFDSLNDDQKVDYYTRELIARGLKDSFALRNEMKKTREAYVPS